MKKNPLNDSDIDGNTLNIPVADNDKYHCPVCDGYVPEDEWNDKKQMCYDCFWGIKENINGTKS